MATPEARGPAEAGYGDAPGARLPDRAVRPRAARVAGAASRTAASRPLGITLGQPVAVLANRSAGRGRHAGAFGEVLARLKAAGHPVDVLDAPDRDGALAAARRAVHDGAAALVAVGGDGTMHLALQAVAGTATPLGVVPAGTGNDFATEVGLPTDPLAAAAAIARGLASGRGRAIDLARMTTVAPAAPVPAAPALGAPWTPAPAEEPVWFGAVLGAGFDAIVNERANRMRWPRGPRRYDLAIVAELARLRARTYTVTLDGVTTEEPAILVAVGNTASYGGGLRVCPDADPTDGLLDVVIGRPMSRFTLTRLKPRLYTGTHVDDPLVVQHRARSVVLAADDITTYADGERSLPLPVTITAVPGALTLLG